MDFSEQFDQITKGVELQRPLPRLHKRLKGVFTEMYEGKWDGDDDKPVTGKAFDELTTEMADNTLDRAFHSDNTVRRLNRQFIATLLRDWRQW
jgi:hypothetical protein